MAVLFANNNSLSAITALPSDVSGGAMTLLETQTASSDSTLSFTSNIDSTYKEYIFKFTDIHPGTDNKYFQFQTDTGTNTSYNQTITSSSFYAYQEEDGSPAALSYATGNDQAQGTGFQRLSDEVGNENDESCSGTLQIFEPSSTTFVKHFISRFSTYYGYGSGYIVDSYIAGYVNTTTALTRFQFKMNSGNIDSGTIKLYGIS
mgnify:CR=1 FL=1|tara:strand:+ start:103 stop:714 length:612 start_codon:yes stop_codon:yes gene_type:complete